MLRVVYEHLSVVYEGGQLHQPACAPPDVSARIAIPSGSHGLRRPLTAAAVFIRQLGYLRCPASPCPFSLSADSQHAALPLSLSPFHCLLPHVMSLFDYQPGELSRLLDPNAKPDIYQWPQPAALATAKSNKRTLDSVQHDKQPEKARKKKKLDEPHSHGDDQPQQHEGSQRRKREKKAEVEVRSETPEDSKANTTNHHDGDDEADGDVDDDDDDDDDGELSDLSDVDVGGLYADMDAATARQLRAQKRLHEDHQIEQPHTKHKPTTSHDTDPRLPRTLFVGNVPTTATRQQLARFFKQYGGVESCRLRSFSVSNPKLSKRVAIIKGAIHPQSQSMNAYVVYDTVEAVDSAVASSGIEYEGHKLRLDYADSSKSTASRAKAGSVSAGLSVFVGNLPFNVSEQQLYDVFDGCGAVTAVRVVRDPLLALGKGFAFVTFDTTAAVKRALAMQGVAIDGRELRLTRAMDETKARQIRDKRRQDALPATSGAARRLQDKVKHAQRKAAEAVAGSGRRERKGKLYVGEVSNPLEFVQKARRVEKKQKTMKQERRKKRSLVRVKKPRMKPTPDSSLGASSSKVSKDS